MNNYPKVLYICARSKSYFEESGDEEHYLWHARASSIPKENFNVLYTPDNKFPEVIKEDVVIIGGSNLSVYDDADWIKPLEKFVLRVFEQKKKMFGVCFGHQIIAKALGGEVMRGCRGSETGVLEVSLTEEGLEDGLFEGFGDKINALEFHRDIITKLPLVDVKVLANSDKYPYQVLSYGKNVKTTQFHPEITTKIMEKEINAHKDEMLKLGYFMGEFEIADKLKTLKDPDFEQNGKQIYKNFLKIS